MAFGYVTKAPVCVGVLSIAIVDSSNNGEEAPHLLSQLKEKNRTLQEENQLLKFKVELLLDMVCRFQRGLGLI